MESFLVWDGSREKSFILELAAYPCLPGASRDERFETHMPSAKNLRGKWETLHRCGLVFEHATSIKVILTDGHGSHMWLKQLLLGQKINLPEPLMELLPFWRGLVYEDLPVTCIPLPWRVVKVKNETIHLIPGT